MLEVVSAYRSAPRCPRCRRTLDFLAVGSGSAWGCTACSGVLLDDEAMGFVRSSLYASIAASAPVPMDLDPWDPSPALVCPRCDAPMRRTELSGVAVDCCVEHGTWFDARELVAVAYCLARQADDRRGVPPEYGFMPWAATPEAAETLKVLNDQLRFHIDATLLAEGVRHLQGWGRR